VKEEAEEDLNVMEIKKKQASNRQRQKLCTKSKGAEPNVL
jgi:hypothetical protein